jgi:hypothetical protein
MTELTTEIDRLGDREEVDPELLELPDPPKGERRMTLVLLLVTALASLAMVFSLRHDAVYAFAPSASSDLGDLRTADAASFRANTFAMGKGMLASSQALRYERPFESDTYRIAPVAGRPNVWVEVRVPAGQEGSRYVPKEEFSGRLVPFSSTGPRHRGLAGALTAETGLVVTQDAWLVVDGEAPADSRWAVSLVALFSAFALWNLVAFFRLARKVRG